MFAISINAVWASDVEDSNDTLKRKDYVTALKKYKSAAGKKDAFAQLQVDSIYNEGRSVAQDDAEAVRWYKLAAAQGNAFAQLNLGIMYSKGQGAVKNYARAYMWFNLATAKFNEIKISNRDLIAKQMTLQQIAEAQKLARECQARNFKNCV